MTRRLLLGLSAAGLMMALSSPPSAEAAHRHSRSCGHRYYDSRYGSRYDHGRSYGRSYGYAYSSPRYYGYDPYAYGPYYSSRYSPYYGPYYSPYVYKPYRYKPYRRYRRPHVSIHLDF
jgi:hypothetical protein